MIWPFSKLRERKASLPDNAFYRELFSAIASKTGVLVNWRTAMEAVTAMACARVIAEGLAQVPCKLFRKQGSTRTTAEDHRLYSLLDDSPNTWMTSFEFFETMGLHLVFCSNFYAFVNRYRGEVLEILPYEPQHVHVEREGFDLRYWVTSTLSGGGTTRIEVPVANMWHVRGPSWNSWQGLEGVKLAREAIGLAISTEEHGAKTFRNGAKIGGVLSTDQVLSKDKAREIREAWEETYGGAENAGKTAVVWGGLKYMATSMLNDQAQFIETRKFQVEEVCRAFRVMPIMVGYSDKTATYASAEQMFIAHAVHTLGPWYRRVEKSAKKFLLTERERDAGYYVKFMANALMRTSAKDRAEYYAKALGSGGSPAWMCQDEVRDWEELNPMGGSAGELPKATNVTSSAGENNA